MFLVLQKQMPLFTCSRQPLFDGLTSFPSLEANVLTCCIISLFIRSLLKFYFILEITGPVGCANWIPFWALIELAFSECSR